jgi:hypothetical protein
MDMADLYDHEVAKIGPIWQRLMSEFGQKPSTRRNLEELAKRAAEEFVKIGLVVEVNTAPCLIYDVRTGTGGSPEIVIMGRVPGTEYTEDGVPLFDHERKRAEVVLSRDRGEDFAGQKFKPL